MATSFPTDLDNLVNPTSSSSVQNPSHAQQHADANDAIEALQVKVGKNNSTDPNSLDYKVKTLETNYKDAEAIQDISALLLNHSYHTNLTTQYDDANNRIILSVAPPDVARVIYQTVVNQGSTTLYKGTPVYVNGSIGASGKLTVAVSSSATEATSSKTFGILAEDILPGNEGQLIAEGLLTNLSTIGANDGDPVWLGSNGTKIYGLSNKPKAPNHLVFLGIVVRGGQENTGSIFVKIQNGFEINELHDVAITSPVTGNILVYNQTTGLWENSLNLDTLASKTYVDTAVSGLQNTSDNTYVPISDLGQPDGVATLDSQGYVPQSQLNIDERIQDTAASLITSGTHYNITVSYDDANNKLSLTATYDDEEVMDAIANALTAGNGIVKTYDDAADKINISVDTTVIATQTYVNTAVANLINSAPEVLDTLQEIAAAINNDANFATTITNALALKAPLASPSLTGTPTAPTATPGTNTTQIATTAFVSDSAATTLQSGKTYTDNQINALTTNDIEEGNSNKYFTDERAQDAAAALFTHISHNNVTATYDDENNKVILSVTPQLTQEQAQDYIAPLFTHNNNKNMNILYDDTNNQLILEAITEPSKAVMSPTAPSNPADGAFWLDTDELRSGDVLALKIWNAAGNKWEYAASALSLSTTNVWTARNTFNQGVVIGLNSAPANPVEGQVYYNLAAEKLRIFDGLIWKDVSGGASGGGLPAVSTDGSANPSTLFFGMIAPPNAAALEGDIWFDIDDLGTPFNQFYTGTTAPDPTAYEFWVDPNPAPGELIYSADEPTTPQYVGELWIDTDEYEGQLLQIAETAPDPSIVQLWVDTTDNETPTYYSNLTFTNYSTINDFPTTASNGFLAVATDTGKPYVRVNNSWLELATNTGIAQNLDDLAALSWLGLE